jgi:hypothetical protein
MHLYIANNLDWMKVWIEDVNEVYHSLSWSGVVELIRRDYVDNDTNMT